MFLFFLPLIAVASAATLGPSVQSPLSKAARTSHSFVEKPIDSIFLKLPSEEDIENIIFSADGVALTRLLQTIEIKGEQIPCDALVAYSDQILGMIKVGLEKKSLSSQQLKVIIQSAEVQIGRLTQEITRIADEKDQLKISILRINLEVMLQKLTSKYELFNQEKKKLPTLSATLEGYRNEMQIIQKSADRDYSLITMRKLNVTDYETQIKKLQSELQNLKAKKASAQEEMKKAEGRVNMAERTIKKIESSIRQTEDEVSRVNENIDGLRKQYTQIEIEVERMRTDLTIEVQKESKMGDKIKEYQNRVLEQRNLLAYRELEFLNSMVRTLGRALPGFFNQNNQIYYSCFSEGVEEEKSESEIVYLIKGERFYDYVSSVYDYQGNPITLEEKIRLNQVNVFGSLWNSQFGASFKLSSSNQQTSHISPDFNCLSPSQVSSGSGVITSIKGTTILIESKGKKLTLNIGACSRIETTEALPRVGQTIAYKGIVSQNGSEANIYSAICF